jgi:hypothetical protein
MCSEEFGKKNSPHVSNFPTFICVGVGRAGTTSLYAYLRQHPDVYVTPVKEPRYFAFRKNEEPTDPRRREIYEASVTDREEYDALFDDRVGETAAGEVSPIYLHEPVAPARIKEAVPDVRLIAILRNPVDRAYSYFGLNVRMGKARLGEFKSAVRSGEHKDKSSLFYKKYIHPGMYAQHLKRYKNYFEGDKIISLKFKNYCTKTKEKMKKIYRHIGVKESFDVDTSIARNPSGVPKFNWLNILLSKKNPFITEKNVKYIPKFIRYAVTILKNANIKSLPYLDSSVRTELLDVYSADIRRLDSLVHWSVDDWLGSDA